MKVQNAQAAGASGVIIFNEGNPGRTGLLSGGLVDAAGNPIVPTIPVAFTSFDIGKTSQPVPAGGAGGTPLPVMNLSIQAVVDPNRDD